MPSLFWIGNPFFVHSLSQCGWEKVYYHNFSTLRVFSWEEIVSLANFEPDIVVVADKSIPPFVLGMEDFPALTVFYAIDSHLHSWFPLYAQGFDAAFVSLYDHMAHFVGQFLPSERIFWSPPFAQDDFRPKEKKTEKKWDCIFVGSVNDTTPLRKHFLHELSRFIPDLYVVTGNFVELFPQARVVLNFCEHGDLNFRVFEAMGMGSALVSPRIGNGQDLLFQDGKHFLLFDPNSVEDAYAQIKRLLENPSLRASLEKEGLAQIDAKHRASHRAKRFTERILELWQSRNTLLATRKAHASSIHNALRFLYLLWAKETEGDDLKQAYFDAAKKRPL